MRGYFATDSYRGKRDLNWFHWIFPRLDPLGENPER